jgi:prepilin-type N-terminal cleavage/methylation domain-containing protein
MSIGPGRQDREASDRRSPSRGSGPAPTRSERAFTLLELLAVVTILGMAMLLVLPNVGATQGAVLTNDARELAAAIEFTRQRAAMTGRPHRMLVAVDDGLYRIEWFVSEAEAEAAVEDDGEPAGETWEDLDLSGGDPIPMSPPQAGWRDYQPIPSRFGQDNWLSPGISFAGVQTPEGWLDSGDVAVVFDRDGTTDSAEIELADDDGRSLVLEIRPLQDVVRIRATSDAV